MSPSPVLDPPAGFAYVPTREQIETARVSRLIERLGAASIDDLRARSAAEPEWFWSAVLEDLEIPFAVPPSAILDESGGPEWTRWFVGGQINVATACVDRWADDPETAAGTALIAEREDGTVRRLSFRELADAVDRAAAGLRGLGVGPGDAVGLYMPMIAEAAIGFYAIAKVGAICVPVFSGFAAAAIAARLEDAGCKFVLCADGTVRKGRPQAMKPILDEALGMYTGVRTAVVVEQLGGDPPMRAGRDISWTDFMDAADPAAGRQAEPTSSEHPFLLAYTSGTTGRPKGAVHVHGGFLVKVASEAAYSLDVGRGDRLLWVTDMGWIMGPWCLLGAHAQGAGVVFLEAAPDHPGPGRLWESAARHEVTQLGVSPTLVRALRKAGEQHARGHDLSSLRALGSTGEPWNPGPYEWLMEVTGRGRPIINISGGTEVGACLLAPYPVEPLKPCSLGGPCLGMAMDVFDADGAPLRGAVGELVCTRPWPGMTRGVWGDSGRYLRSYWSRYPGVWWHGDRALIDADGQWFVLGRSDDAINVAGKRLGPAEVESVLVADPAVADAAAVGVPDDLKGEALWCFWAAAGEAGEEDSERLANLVAERLGRPFRPSRTVLVEGIPHTRSAKVLRRALRAAATGEDPGDLSSAEDPELIERIRTRLGDAPTKC